MTFVLQVSGGFLTVKAVSQEISPPGKNVAATKFPGIYGRSSITERPYFLGIIVALSKIRRSQLCANINPSASLRCTKDNTTYC